MPGRRIGVFVDVAHQYTIVKERYNKRINYEKYLAYATGEECLISAFAYGTQISSEATWFITKLKALGYETFYKKAPLDSELKVDLNAVDFTVQMTLDIVRCLNRLDIVVIGSNDSKFIPVVKFVQEQGGRVVIFASMIPAELVAVANKAIEIPLDILDKVRQS